MRVVKWLGSASCAIMLIALCSGFVILGTVIESKTGSHKAASKWVYSNPLFILVLWGFFVNILLATLKRFPFKRHHIPFIITHMGLLMMISGTLLKYSFGLQGTVALKEGTSTQWVVLDDTWALSLQKKGSADWHQIPLKRTLWGRLKVDYNWENLAIEIRGLAPHGEEKIQSWIKKDNLVLLGHPPIPLGVSTKLGEHHVIAANDADTIKRSLKGLPALVFLQDPPGTTTIMEILPNGEVRHQEYSQEKLTPLYAYDEGRQGYTMAFPFEGKDLETPLTREYSPKDPPEKSEEERPLIALSLREGYQEEKIALAFNSNLPTGALSGEYLLRFEPLRARLPETLRLKRAQATHYPNSSQPSSYTAHIRANQEDITLQMNKVWESPQGHRFYLANLAPLDESDVKQVRLVVNRDPFKYFLTYPGAFILALGIVLLFRQQTQKSKTHKKI